MQAKAASLWETMPISVSLCRGWDQ